MIRCRKASLMLLLIVLMGPTSSAFAQAPEESLLNRSPTENVFKPNEKHRFICIYLATTEEIQTAPKIIEVEGKEFGKVGDVIVVHSDVPLKEGGHYVIFHQGDMRFDARHQRVLGFEIVSVGEANVISTYPETKLKITEQTGRIQAGDRLISRIPNDTGSQ